MATRRVGRAAALIVLVALALFAGSSLSEEAAGEAPLTVRYEYQLGENVERVEQRHRAEAPTHTAPNRQKATDARSEAAHR